jgi:hypothetical protein
VKDAPHTYGAQNRSHPCISSYHGRRCSCTSTRRNTCARGMGGGTRGRKEVQQRRRRQHYPRLTPVHCAFAIASASSSSLAGISEFSRRPLSLAIPEASSPICVPASPFLHANVLGAPSPALPPQLPWRDHPLPACACAHSIVGAQHHSPKVGQARLFPTAAHLSLISLMVLTHLLF